MTEFTKQLLSTCKSGDWDSIEELLAQGFNLENRITEEGDTLLTYAIRYGQEDLAMQLLYHGANPMVTLKDGRTAAMLAATLESSGTLFLLVNAEVDLTVRDKKGLSALAYAIQNKRDSSIIYLICFGADPCERDQDGKYLLCSVDPYLTYPNMGQFLTKIERAKNYIRLSQSAVSNWQNEVDVAGVPLPCYLAQYGLPNELEYFLNFGTDADTLNPNGDSLLHLACRSHHLECVQILLKHGASINLLSKAGRTPLMAAMEYCPDERIIQYLLRKGADPKIISPADRITALQVMDSYPLDDETIIQMRQRIKSCLQGKK